MTRRVLVMNCNTSQAMTETIGRGARASARPGTEIIADRPRWGPESAEGYYDSYITAAAVLDRLETTDAVFDGVVMAGFGEHGREGARELLDVPVVDVTEAGAHLAMLLGHAYGVVTTLRRAAAPIQDSLRTAGLLQACVAIEACELGVLALEEDPAATLQALHDAGARALTAGAEVLVLGCAGMTGTARALAAKLDVPVVDPVAAGVVLVESLIDLRLATSKTSSYAPPRAKQRAGWPVTRRSDRTAR